MNMFKDYLKENKISMYKLSLESGVAYSTINDLANGRVDVANCKAGMLRKLAETLSISMDELYSICDRDLTVYSKTYDTTINISVKNKTYYADFEYEGEKQRLLVCEANEINTKMVRGISELKAEEYIEEAKFLEGNIK